MIATHIPSRGFAVTRRLLGGLIVVLGSLLAVAATARVQDYAVGVTAFLLLVGLTVWRPRYGLYGLFVIIFTLEAGAPNDPVMAVGQKYLSNVSSWSPFGFLIFSPVELLLLAVTVMVLVQAVVNRRALRFPQLVAPLLLFLLLTTISIGFGYVRGGILNIALWETRSLFIAGLVAIVVPNVLERREHVHHLINLICISVLLLSIETIWRKYTLLPEDVLPEQAFGHETPVFMDFVVILLLARLIWPATTGQRLAAFAIPLILYAQMVTERRAGWIGLDVGMILLAIFVFRLRRKLFFFVVLPGLVFYVGYLAAFWRAEGPIAQPARAVRSINDPEGRDINSNLARMLETANLRINIHANPVTGIGFGRKYIDYTGEFYLGWWPFWHYMAHNSVLWIWVKMGTFGFFVFLAWLGAGVVRGVQLLKQAANDRTAPILAALVSALTMLVVYFWVDLGMTNPRAMAVLGLVLGLIGMWGREAAAQEEQFS